MGRSFVLRVRSDSPQGVRALRALLEEAFRARGARVDLQEEAHAGGNAVVPAVRDEEGVPRWLAPVPVHADPAVAAREAVAFLERWGFLSRVVSSRPAA